MTINISNNNGISSLANSLQGALSASLFSFKGHEIRITEEQVNQLFEKVVTLDSICTQDRIYKRPRKAKPIEQEIPQDLDLGQDNSVSSDDENEEITDITSSDDDFDNVVPFCGPVRKHDMQETPIIYDEDDLELDPDFAPDEEIEQEEIAEEPAEEEQARLIEPQENYMKLRNGKKVYFRPELVKLYHYFPPASRLPLHCK